MLITAVTLAAFIWGLATADDEPRAVTLAFMTLALAQIFHLGNARSGEHVVSAAAALRNPWAVGAIAVSQRENSIKTGRGQNMKPMSMDDYPNAPLVTDPLRYPDCCLISDGAAAFVMTSGERARDCAKRPAYVRGVAFASDGLNGDDMFTQRPDLLTLPSVALP